MMRRHLTLPDASLVHVGKVVPDALVADGYNPPL